MLGKNIISGQSPLSLLWAQRFPAPCSYDAVAMGMCRMNFSSWLAGSVPAAQGSRMSGQRANSSIFCTAPQLPFSIPNSWLQILNSYRTWKAKGKQPRGFLTGKAKLTSQQLPEVCTCSGSATLLLFFWSFICAVLLTLLARQTRLFRSTEGWKPGQLKTFG